MSEHLSGLARAVDPAGSEPRAGFVDPGNAALPAGWILLPVLLGAMLTWVGCASKSSSQYTSPRVSGTVLDAHSRQPLQDVRVRRLGDSRPMDPNVPARGGEVMARESAIFTAADGTFVLDSVTDLAVFRKVSWYTVSLSFERAGFERMVTTYTPANAVVSSKGEPVVDAGIVLLQPVSK